LDEKNGGDQAISERFTLAQTIRERAKNSLNKRDHLAAAAYWQLEAKLHTDEKIMEYCLSQSYIQLAIFSKRNGFLSEAAEYYEAAYNILSKDPSSTNSAKLQLANSLDCKARVALKEGSFQDAVNFFEQVSQLFRQIGKSREAIFFEAKKLEAQARERENSQEFFSASELFAKASQITEKVAEMRSIKYNAFSLLNKGRYEEEQENFKAAMEYFEQASKLFQKINDPNEQAWCKGAALECKAYMLKLDPKQPFSEVAKTFHEAAEQYAKTPFKEWGIPPEADAYKYFGLDAKVRGSFQEAAEYFTKAKTLYLKLLRHAKTSQAKEIYMRSETWCEGIEIATKAEKELLAAIPRKESMGDVLKLLAHAADLLSKSGDDKHAEMVSGLMLFVTSIEAFHNEDIPKANLLVQEARERLPAEFVHSILKDEVNVRWQPLRYALEMLKTFNKYSRRLETEKGYSFESRIRELLRKKYRQYDEIEGKVFTPEDDEIGIVFKDKTPIEIDVIGMRKQGNKYFILVGEIKNLTKLIVPNDIEKFLRKIQFIEKRYERVARLQSMDKPEIEKKLYISASGFMPAAQGMAIRNNVEIMDKDSIRKLFRELHLFPIPK